MTIKEMKEAWVTQVPVVLKIEVINPRSETDGLIKYKRIIGYAKELTAPHGEIDYTVKLEDYSGHSVTYASPEDLRLAV